MRGWALVLSSLLLSVLLSAAIPAGADGSSWGPEEVLVHLRVRFDTVRSGELRLFIGNASEGPMVLDEGSAPVIKQGPDSNLVRVHEALSSFNATWVSLLRSVLDPGGDVNVTGPSLLFSSKDSRFGSLFMARFSVTGNDSPPDYRLLSFLRTIRPRKLDPKDPYSSIERDRDIERLSKVVLRIAIEPPAGTNMDLQFDGTAHTRGLTSEMFDRTLTLIEFNDLGNGLVMSGSFMFTPQVVLVLSVGTTLAASILITAAWVRKRFHGWALIFPLITMAPCLFTLWTFVRPYINIYGTFEGGMMASAFVMLTAVLALQFAPDGRNKGERPPSVENDAEEGPVDLEMPKVVYVDRHVFVNVDTNRKRAGAGEEDDAPYRVLGVTRDADDEEVDKAFREKIRLYHPDKFENGPDWVRDRAKEETVRLNRAYEVLKKEKL